LPTAVLAARLLDCILVGALTIEANTGSKRGVRARASERANHWARTGPHLSHASWSPLPVNSPRGHCTERSQGDHVGPSASRKEPDAQAVNTMRPRRNECKGKRRYRCTRRGALSRVESSRTRAARNRPNVQRSVALAVASGQARIAWVRCSRKGPEVIECRAKGLREHCGAQAASTQKGFSQAVAPNPSADVPLLHAKHVVCDCAFCDVPARETTVG
jgi:hypothetical protein